MWSLSSVFIFVFFWPKWGYPFSPILWFFRQFSYLSELFLHSKRLCVPIFRQEIYFDYWRPKRRQWTNLKDQERCQLKSCFSKQLSGQYSKTVGLLICFLALVCSHIHYSAWIRQGKLKIWSMVKENLEFWIDFVFVFEPGCWCSFFRPTGKPYFGFFSFLLVVNAK